MTGKKKKDIYLIGPQISRFRMRKLPTTGEVLSLFFYKHNELKLTVRKSAMETMEAVQQLWNRAEIPVSQLHHSVKKLVSLHTVWKNLRKSQRRKKSVPQQLKERKFTSSLKQLFNIARTDAIQSLTETQRHFLASQSHNSRRGFLPASPKENHDEKENQTPSMVALDDNVDDENFQSSYEI